MGTWNVTPSQGVTFSPSASDDNPTISFPANESSSEKTYTVKYNDGNGNCGSMKVRQKPGSGGGGGGEQEGSCKIRIVNTTSESFALSCHECTANPKFDAKIYVGDNGYYSARIELPHSTINIGPNGKYPDSDLYSTSFMNDGDSSMTFYNNRTRHNNLYESGVNITDGHGVYVFIKGINGTDNKFVDGGEYEITIEN